MSTTTGTLLAYVENKTQAGTGTLNVVNPGINFLNEAMLDFRGELIGMGIDAAQTQEAYTSGAVAVSNSGSTFAWPSDMWRLKTIEVNMTDTTQNNYIQATALDVANTPSGTSMDWIRLNQAADNPLFDNRGDTFEIFPSFSGTSNLTNAIKIIYFLTPTLYTTTSDVLQYPDSIHWQMLAVKVASIYFQSLSKFNEAEYWENQYKKKLKDLVYAIQPESQQPTSTSGISLTGFEF